jgi:RNA polymerase sigma-70 factor (family 1)
MAVVMEKDTRLLIELSAGNQYAFAQAFEAYGKALYEFARQSIETKEDCEEIVQDVFVSLWERREELEIESLKAYLFASVKYKVIRYIQHRVVMRKYEEHYRHFETTYIAPIEPESVSRMIPLQTRLSESLQDLPARCREAFQLRIEQNLTNSEIAERMHVSKRTVEDYMTTAFAHLRKFRKEILGAE